MSQGVQVFEEQILADVLEVADASTFPYIGGVDILSAWPRLIYLISRSQYDMKLM